MEMLTVIQDLSCLNKFLSFNRGVHDVTSTVNGDDIYLFRCILLSIDIRRCGMSANETTLHPSCCDCILLFKK